MTLDRKDTRSNNRYRSVPRRNRTFTHSSSGVIFDPTLFNMENKFQGRQSKKKKKKRTLNGLKTLLTPKEENVAFYTLDTTVTDPSR